MKQKLAMLVLMVVALSAPCVFAIDDITPPASGFYDGTVNEAARVALSNAIRAAVSAEIAGAFTSFTSSVPATVVSNAFVAADVVLAASMVAQADTNVTSTSTLYTPRRVGDVLMGGAGSGTNAVWVSKGTTTNDWVQLKP